MKTTTKTKRRVRWVTKTIRLCMFDGSFEPRRAAVIDGRLAVHRGAPAYTGWRITHVRSGYRVCGALPTEESALALAAALVTRKKLWDRLEGVANDGAGGCRRISFRDFEWVHRVVRLHKGVRLLTKKEIKRAYERDVT